MHLEVMQGFGRYPVVRGEREEPRDRDALPAAARGGGDWIAQGNLRSYGDAALAARVVATGALRSVLELDPETGRARVEAGATIGDLTRCALSVGRFPSVVPGTALATVGGCVAADVHGKNHHVDGSFGEQVEAFGLVLPSGDRVRCSRQSDPELFHATLGGMGLTGIVDEVELRLRPVETAWIRQRAVRARDLEECFDLLERLEAATYSVAWVDGLARGRRFGRSVVLAGEHATSSELGDDRSPFAVPARKVRRIRRPAPSFLLSRLAMRVFNALYFRAPRREELVPYDAFFHPLDALDGWNLLYGRRGFVQYQCVVPFEGGRAVIREVLERFTRDTTGPFLSVLKTFGRGAMGPLSFPMPGYTLAVDVPMRGTRVIDAARRCDRAVREAGGRVYLAKDATLRREDFEAMYPRFEEMLRVKARVDPEGRLRSCQSDRLGLT